ncbi:hypothetical protein HHI36_017256 [Cryptolaemus montrouzieri]|uniref:Uncharacterized protein n=1 Tax=Cryptolaemus montrouzieri TaxID=559131 RepID=A0ABD2NM05_9CUCU
MEEEETPVAQTLQHALVGEKSPPGNGSMNLEEENSGNKERTVEETGARSLARASCGFNESLGRCLAKPNPSPALASTSRLAAGRAKRTRSDGSCPEAHGKRYNPTHTGLPMIHSPSGESASEILQKRRESLTLYSRISKLTRRRKTSG